MGNKATNIKKFQDTPQRELPLQFSDKYTAQDKQDVEYIIEWLNSRERTASWLAQAANVNRTTMQLILAGSYTGRVSAYLKPMLQAMKHMDARKTIRETPFIPSSVSRLLWTACQRARKYKSFSIITAEVGTGKTRAVDEYRNEHPNTALIEADPLMSPSSLLDDLVSWLRIESIGGYVTREKKFRAVIERLRNTDSLIILDEAETVNPRTLEHLRRIRDKANIGVVLTGTPRLHMLIAPIGGQFDQIRSRTGFWPRPVRAITVDDANAVLCAAYDDLEVDDAVMKAFWQHCKGSMRMLVEDLIPAVRDYGLKKHELSPDLVHKIARDVLSLTE